MTNEELLDKITQVMARHVYQVEADATSLTKDGKMKGFSTYDSQVLERYAKVLITLTKKSETAADEFDSMSDEELQQELDKIQREKEVPHADETSDRE